jgi:hypothetical protein
MDSKIENKHALSIWESSTLGRCNSKKKTPNCILHKDNGPENNAL